MKVVLDASDVVAALRRDEPARETALQRCIALERSGTRLVVPATFDVEIASAVTRRGGDPKAALTFVERNLPARRLVPIGRRALVAVLAVIEVTKLRAADALYVGVAAREGLPLVTLDRKILDRAALAGVAATPP